MLKEVFQIEGWRSFQTNPQLGKGKGIKIAHVDSGINQWHPHIHNVAGGVAIKVTPEGRLEISENFADHLGHGTAVAGVLSEQVPEAQVWAVKVFDENLFTHIEVLCAAVEWCIEQEMDIINLSLSVKKDIKAFREMCEEAENAGIIVVSSCDKRRGLTWPGSYPTVFGVETGERAQPNLCFYHPDEEISFQAYGLPRQLEGPMQKYNLNGHSFAAAYVSSYMAKIIEKYKVKSKKEMMIKLEEIVS